MTLKQLNDQYGKLKRDITLLRGYISNSEYERIKNNIRLSYAKEVHKIMGE